MGVSVTIDPIRAAAGRIVLGYIIATIAVLFFQAPRTQPVATARSDIEAGAELDSDRAEALNRIGLIREAGPAGLSTDIILRPSIRAEHSQNECEARPCHQRDPHYHVLSSRLQDPRAAGSPSCWADRFND